MSNQKVKQFIKELPEHKKYIDVFTAMLTVPIMLTAIVTSYTNLKNNTAKAEEKSATPTPIIKEKETVQIVPVKVEVTLPPTTISVGPTTAPTNSPQPTQSVLQDQPILTPTSIPSATPTITITPAPTDKVSTDSAN